MLKKDTNTQKNHGKNLIGTKYSFEKVFIYILFLEYFFLTIFGNRFNCSILYKNNIKIHKDIKSLKIHNKINRPQLSIAKKSNFQIQLDNLLFLRYRSLNHSNVL